MFCLFFEFQGFTILFRRGELYELNRLIIVILNHLFDFVQRDVEELAALVNKIQFTISKGVVKRSFQFGGIVGEDHRMYIEVKRH